MILKLIHINKSFGRKKILNDINLNIGGQAIIGITGENGSGKSTLLKLITGDLKPSSGKIKYIGTIGYCPQECILYNQLTVRENFEYFSIGYGLKREESYKKMNYLADYFFFEKYLDIQIRHLSGGTRQKINLSIALLHDPDLLILDEPYSGFDWKTYKRFWEYTKILLAGGSTVLIVAHLLSNTEDFTKILELSEGKLI